MYVSRKLGQIHHVMEDDGWYRPRLLHLLLQAMWRAIVDTFRTLCLAPAAEVRAVFDDLANLAARA